jgi:hypothetical protein
MAYQAAREGHPGEAITPIDTAMTGVRGRATPRLLTLGKAGQAATLLGEGIALLDESFVRDRQHYLIRHAEALVHPGPRRDLEAALERGRAALDLSRHLDSTQSADLLRDLLSQLGPHSPVPAVRDFIDRTRDLVTV